MQRSKKRFGRPHGEHGLGDKGRGQHVPDHAPSMPLRADPLALDVPALAAALRVSVRTVHRLRDQGRLPEPLKLGRSLVWPVDGPNGIRAWLAANAPDAATWASMIEKQHRRRAG